MDALLKAQAELVNGGSVAITAGADLDVKLGEVWTDYALEVFLVRGWNKVVQQGR